MIDSHCHLTYFPDPDEIIDRAQQMGVTQLLTIATSLEEYDAIREVCLRHENVKASAGIHPCQALDHPDVFSRLEEQLSHRHIVALGETGLDFFHKDAPSENIQRSCFEAHISLSEKYQKPLVIHSRDADQAMIEMLKKCEYPGILHCFTGGYELAKKALDRDFYISFSGILTYPSANDLVEVAKKLPLNRILIETDAPYLTPQRKRKTHKTNEPAFVVYVAEKLAECFDLDLEKIEQITTENYEKLCGGR